MGRLNYNFCISCGLNTYKSIGSTHDCPELPRSDKRGKRCDEPPEKCAEWDRAKQLVDNHNNFRTNGCHQGAVAVPSHPEVPKCEATVTVLQANGSLVLCIHHQSTSVISQRFLRKTLPIRAFLLRDFSGQMVSDAAINAIFE